MGMYTEVFFRAVLKKDVPPEVIALLQAWVAGDPPTVVLPDHPFFECDRWQFLPNGGSAYFPTGSASFRKSDWGGRRELLFHSSLKNYDGEAHKFFDWISPYTEGYGGEFLGYTLYEEAETPDLYYRTEATQ